MTWLLRLAGRASEFLTPRADSRRFPDGGKPKYVTDANLPGTFDLQTRKIRILRREKNSHWQPGSGLFTIHATKGYNALISQGGQLRESFKLEIKYVLVFSNLSGVD
jgi:hypothetical protein